jgi:P4 family phage/plasmid primase-like protien
MVTIPDVFIRRLSIVGTKRFIRVSKGDKVPVDDGWQKTANLRGPDNPQLQAWLKTGGNYGVVGGQGLVIIDADDKELDRICEKELGSTFTVQSPGSKMHHRYYQTDLNVSLRLKNKNGENIGDIQGTGKQVLGPGSIHPNGEPYRIVKDSGLKYISKEKIRDVLGDWIIKEKAIQQAEQAAVLETSKIALTMSEVLNFYGIRLKPHGEELYGVHPIHGSKGGQNFWVNPSKNVWHCFRCESGGGPLSLMAVIEGMIVCEQAGKGALRGDKFIEVLKKGEELGLVQGSTVKVQINGKIIESDPEDFFTKRRDKDGNVTGIKTFVPQRLGEKIKEDYKFFSFDEKSDVYYYNEAKGTWEENGVILIRGLCQRYLGPLYKMNHIREALAYIRDGFYISRDDVDNDLYRIPVKNGVLNLKTFELESFDPELYAITFIPTKYDPDAKCPKILKFIDEVAPQDKETLQEWIGYHLLRTYVYQKCVQLIGDGNNGKSTFLRLLEALLGKDNVSNATLYDLVSTRFSKADLYGRLANIAPDISPDELKRTGTFKALTGGDYIRAEKKHQNAFKFLNYAKLSFSANQLPPSPDKTVAFFRRWLLINFPNKFEGPDCDPRILEKLTTPEELSGLLNWALEGLKRLMKNDDFTKSQTIEELQEQWERMSDPVTAFVTNCVEPAFDDTITKDSLYNAYYKFCRSRGLPYVRNNILTKNLKPVVPIILGVGLNETTHNKKNCWQGIRLLCQECGQCQEAQPKQEKTTTTLFDVPPLCEECGDPISDDSNITWRDGRRVCRRCQGFLIEFYKKEKENG